MKYFATITILLLFAFAGKAEDFPPRSNTLVTDCTMTLSPGERQALEQKLVQFNDSTSTQIAVVIMSSTGGYEISDYSVQLYNKWGIGQKGKENGVLILVAKDDRKTWITTGYGIEGVLPDALCKRVVNNDILPNFKQGRFYEGLDQATNSIIGIVKGEFTASDYMKGRGRQQGIPWFVIILFLFIICVVFFARVSSVRKYAHRNDLSFWAAWALMNAALNRGHSHGSWGGFSGGGGFGSGGGFGGFGGGSSGGGGAGGSW